MIKRCTITHVRTQDMLLFIRPWANSIFLDMVSSRQGFSSWGTRHPLPNQQRTLNKLPTELRCRNFVTKHRLEHTNRYQNVQRLVCNVYMFRLSFHFAFHRWRLGVEDNLRVQVRISYRIPVAAHTLVVQLLYHLVVGWKFLQSELLGRVERLFQKKSLSWS